MEFIKALRSKTKFSFENEVKTILRYISGSNKEEDGEKTIFTRKTRKKTVEVGNMRCYIFLTLFSVCITCFFLSF